MAISEEEGLVLDILEEEDGRIPRISEEESALGMLEVADMQVALLLLEGNFRQT